MSWIDVDGKFTRTETVKGKCLIANSIKPIESIKNAPLRYLAIDIECLPDEPRIAEPEKDKIIAISMAFTPAYKGNDTMVILAKSVRGVAGNVVGCADEKAMLEKMRDVINDFDPDIIAGYNINGFDLPFIVKRMELNKVPRDLGR
jgi:DNA polymerase I